jgi:hypothetical protein
VARTPVDKRSAVLLVVAEDRRRLPAARRSTDRSRAAARTAESDLFSGHARRPLPDPVVRLAVEASLTLLRAKRDSFAVIGELSLLGQAG